MNNNIKNMPLTTTHWGTYRADINNDRILALHDFEHDSNPSPIGRDIMDLLDNPLRIKKPMFRKGWLDAQNKDKTNHKDYRGRDDFVALSWDEASILVANELNRVRNAFGNRAIYGGSYGWASAGRFHHAQSQLKRFLNVIGGFTSSVDTYSFAAAEVIIPHILGDFSLILEQTPSWRDIAEHGQLVVAFGGTPIKNSQMSSGGLGDHVQQKLMQQAKQANIQSINISPIKNDMPCFMNAKNIAIRPNTDVALILAICYILYQEDLYDADFIEKYTVGFAQFIDYLCGKYDNIAKTSAWASKICDVDAHIIVTLAKQMASSKTVISLSWSLSRQSHGEQPYWAGVTLAAMLGQIGQKGCGIAFGYSATNSIGDHYQRLLGGSLPQGYNKIADFIPVARISDMLLNPNQQFQYNGKNYTYPNIKLIYWLGGNPFHHHQDLNKLTQAWRKPDTVICHEWCWNTLAKFSDIILPCTTTYERNDFSIATRNDYAIYMSQLMSPIGESLNDFEIFKLIAEHLKCLDEFTDGKNDQQWIAELYKQTIAKSKSIGIDMPDFTKFQQQGYFKADTPLMRDSFLDDLRHNNQALATPSGKIEIFSQAIADMNISGFYAHAAWYEPPEWLDRTDLTLKYPLHLITNQPKDKLHSQYDHSQYSQQHKINGQTPIFINPEDAKKYNISNGDYVRVYNDRGACICGAKIDDGLMRNVIIIPTGAWLDPEFDDDGNLILCYHGNPNILTADRPTSLLGQGPAANSCLVNIEKIDAPIFKKQCFQPPKIIEKP